MKLRTSVGILFFLFCIIFTIKNDSLELFRWFSVLLILIQALAMYYAHHKELAEQDEHRKGLAQQQANESKNEFLSFATHQLRSPLTSIKWGLNAIADMVKEKPEAIKLVEQLRTIADNMVNTVSDLLDISKIEQGGLVLSNEAVDLVETLDQLAEAFRMTATEKGLSFQFHTELPVAIINGDKTKLRQVFTNLIDNAIKYTTSGGVTVSLSYQESSHCFITCVQDTGPGIPKEEISNLFEKFARGTAGKASATKGSGIGLYLGKKIVELHCGSISVSSEGEGKGALFSVALPKNV